jgi:cystathionine beta-lyase
MYLTLLECVHVNHTSTSDNYNASAFPIYQVNLSNLIRTFQKTATFKQNSSDTMGEFDYSRSGNPTRLHLESHLSKVIRGSSRAFVVTSGMTALDMIINALIPSLRSSSSEEIIAGDDLYGGTNRLLSTMSNTTHHVDTTNLEAIYAVLDPVNTRLVLLVESFSNAVSRKLQQTQC